MHKFLLVVASLLLLVSPAAAAPFLAWDPVTTDPQGEVLGPGLEVTAYRVWQCAPGIKPCGKGNGNLVGTVPAPATQFDLAGQAAPGNYAVTAVNKVGESLDSLTFKVTPGDFPKNLRLP